jgi:hypothetical protein
MATLITEPPRLIRVEDAAKLLNVGCSADLDRGAPAAIGPGHENGLDRSPGQQGWS